MSDSQRKELAVLDPMFTQEPLRIGQPGDEDFRLLVDRSISRLYASSGFSELYKRWSRRIRREDAHVLPVEYARRMTADPRSMEELSR